MDSHDWMFDPNFAEKLADALDDWIEENEDEIPGDLQDKKEEEETGTNQRQDQLQNSMRPGSEDGNISKYQDKTGAQLAWVKLLQMVDPDFFKEPGFAKPPRPAWHRRRRKLSAREFEEINLPVTRKDDRDKEAKEIPAIVMALDCSGSIGPDDANRFITLARSIPQERIKLFVCTFEYSYKVLDLENPHGPGLGGTNFDAIVNFIDAEVKPELKGKYPKAVVVVTDGQASLSKAKWPDESEAEGWLWLISPVDRSSANYNASRQIGRRAMLKEFVV
jgi:hypothetical protein